MKTLQFHKLLKAKPAQRDPLATILPTRPRQIRTREIRPIHKHRACLHLRRQTLPYIYIFGPDRRRQPELGVVHVFDRGDVGRDAHEWYDGAEGLVAHDGHVVGDVREEGGFDEVTLRRHVFKTRVWWGFVFCASFHSFVDLGGDYFFRAFRDHGPDLGGFIHWVAECVSREDGLAGVEEGVVDVGVDVDALDGAAGLAGVEDGAVDYFRGGPPGVHVWSDVGGVFAAEFEADVDDAVCGCFLDGEATGHGAGEADVVYLWGADD